MKYPKEYKAWCGIKWRCHCKRGRDYPKYGGRGIQVCKKWRESFSDFLSDVGLAPSQDHSLERIDNDRNYEPGNTRWATVQEQNRNRRNTLRIQHEGVQVYFAEFCGKYGLRYQPSRKKLIAGWTAEEFINGERNEKTYFDNAFIVSTDGMFKG